MEIDREHQPAWTARRCCGKAKAEFRRGKPARLAARTPIPISALRRRWLADRYDGKRLNSPNDLVYRSDGALYFTDPPFGLPRFFDDARKELPYSGVFCLINGELELVNKDLTGPNGLAFSPDEKYLYVDNWDAKRKVIMRYEVHPDGTLSDGQVFLDVTSEPGGDAWDGLKVDVQGNLYAAGPGGLWIVSPKENISAQSSARKIRTTSPGATKTAKHFISARSPACTASA